MGNYSNVWQIYDKLLQICVKLWQNYGKIMTYLWQIYGKLRQINCLLWQIDVKFIINLWHGKLIANL